MTCEYAMPVAIGLSLVAIALAVAAIALDNSTRAILIILSRLLEK